jgi:ADP-ribose pyrophosphatase YjhB (NUDIX family)
MRISGFLCSIKSEQPLRLPGGKREPNETLLAAARCELREELGAVRFDLKPLHIYRVHDENSGEIGKGLLCCAAVRELGALPESEIARVYLMKSCPAQMTYPGVLPHFYAYVTEKFFK